MPSPGFSRTKALVTNSLATNKELKTIGGHVEKQSAKDTQHLVTSGIKPIVAKRHLQQKIEFSGSTPYFDP
jgi:hypothetical protein